MELGLKDKRVLISGSSRGIGAAIARAFLAEKARVVVTSRNQDDLEQLKASWLAEYPSSQYLTERCDFTQSGDVEQLAQRLLEQWGGIDIVVSNVGSGKSLPDPIVSEEHFDQVFQLNFNSAIHTARCFYPLLKESRGNLLFISSITGVEALGAPVDYSVAKSATIAFSKNLARKAAKDHVRVNAIAPGNVFFENGTWDHKIKQNSQAVEQMLQSQVPMQRFGTPEEIADSVLFLCSERASFITGTLLRVDGGQTTGLF